MTKKTGSLREKIRTYANRIKRKGGTYKEAAEKLGISTTTLRRYRKGTQSPSGKTRKKMKRGGKLTQLLDNTRKEDEYTRAPPPSRRHKWFSKELGAYQHSQIENRRGYFPNRIAYVVGDENVLSRDIGKYIGNNVTLHVVARKYRTEDGNERWVIGEQDVGEIVDIEDFEYDMREYETPAQFGNALRQDLLDYNIIGTP